MIFEIRDLPIFNGLMASALFAPIAALWFSRFRMGKKSRALQASERSYRTLVENIPGTVFRATKIGAWQMTYMSDSIESLTGYPASEFVDKPGSFARIVHPDDLKKLRTAVPSVDTRSFDSEIRIIHRSGEVRWLQARAGVAIEPNGKQTLDGIFIDVTEQKNVTERQTQNQMNMASDSRFSALAEMASGIAHEINNPLAIINLRTHQLTQLAARRAITLEDIETFSAQIQATTMRISNIVRSLQTVSRETTHDPIEPTPVKYMVAEALSLSLEKMKKHGVDLIVDPIPEALTVKCKRVQITQVLIHLLSNAFDAVSGEVNRSIRIGCMQTALLGRDAAEIYVIDSGPGIQADVADKIFQPFFTTKGVGKGTGLGLSVAKALVEAHNGRIFLDSSHPATRFAVILPLNAGAGLDLERPKNRSASEITLN